MLVECQTDVRLAAVYKSTVSMAAVVCPVFWHSTEPCDSVTVCTMNVAQTALAANEQSKLTSSCFHNVHHQKQSDGASHAHLHFQMLSLSSEETDLGHKD